MISCEVPAAALGACRFVQSIPVCSPLMRQHRGLPLGLSYQPLITRME